MVAGHTGHEDIVRLLLQNGANINAANDDGMTPLLVAIAGYYYLIEKNLFVKIFCDEIKF